MDRGELSFLQEGHAVLEGDWHCAVAVEVDSRTVFPLQNCIRHNLSIKKFFQRRGVHWYYLADLDPNPPEFHDEAAVDSAHRSVANGAHSAGHAAQPTQDTSLETRETVIAQHISHLKREAAGRVAGGIAQNSDEQGPRQHQQVGHQSSLQYEQHSLQPMGFPPQFMPGAHFMPGYHSGQLPVTRVPARAMMTVESRDQKNPNGVQPPEAGFTGFRQFSSHGAMHPAQQTPDQYTGFPFRPMPYPTAAAPSHSPNWLGGLPAHGMSMSYPGLDPRYHVVTDASGRQFLTLPQGMSLSGAHHQQDESSSALRGPVPNSWPAPRPPSAPSAQEGDRPRLRLRNDSANVPSEPTRLHGTSSSHQTVSEREFGSTHPRNKSIQGSQYFKVAPQTISETVTRLNPSQKRLHTGSSRSHDADADSETHPETSPKQRTETPPPSVDTIAIDAVECADEVPAAEQPRWVQFGPKKPRIVSTKNSTALDHFRAGGTF